MAEPSHLHAVRGADMIRYALACERRATASRAGSRIRPPMTSRPSAGWWPARSAAPPKSRRRSWRRGLPARGNATRRAAECAAASDCRAGTGARAAGSGARSGRDDVAAGAANFARSSRSCASTSPRMPTTSARNFPRKRARCITARSSTARSTAKPRRRGQGAARGRHRVSSAAGAAGRAQLMPVIWPHGRCGMSPRRLRAGGDPVRRVRGLAPIELLPAMVTGQPGNAATTAKTAI